MTSVAAFFFVLVTVTGGFEQLQTLDPNRILNFNDQFAIAFYVLGALLYVGHSIVPQLARGPNGKFVGFALKMAMLEAIALFGFVLGHTKQDAQAAIAFFVLAIVGLVRACPLLKMNRPQRPGTPIT